MRKKLLIVLMGLVGTFCVVYANSHAYTNHNILNAAYPSGKISGRIANPEIGDLIATSIENYDMNGTMDLQIIAKSTYGKQIWFSMSKQPVSPMIYAMNTIPPASNNFADGSKNHYYSTLSNMKQYITALNTRLSSHGMEDAIIYQRRVPTYSYGASQNPDQSETKFFMLFGWEYLSNLAPLGVNVPDLHAGYPYWLGNPTAWPLYQGIDDSFTGWASSTGFRPATDQAYVRASAYLDLSKMVFAISDIYASCPDSDVMIVDHSQSSRMQLRLEKQAPLYIDLEAISKHHRSITEIIQDATIEVEFSNASITSSNMASLLFIDQQTNDFSYYVPLGDLHTGSGTFSDISLKGILPGKYDVYLMNEEASGTDEPIYSSSMIGAKNLEIKEAYQLTSFSAHQNLEFNVNVAQNDIVGEIVDQGGAGRIQYTLISDASMAGHENDYQRFKTGTDLDGKPVIQVADEKGLDAGAYHFKIQAQDANGDPAVPLEIAATVTVAKTDPVLKFATATPINQVIGNPAFTETFTHQNTDVSDPDFALTYSSSLPAVASVDAPGGNSDTDIEITPGATNGSAIIKVELAETKNFKAADAALTVNVHPRISLSFTPDKNTFATSDVASSGTKIGSVTLTGNSPQYEYSLAIDPADPAAGADNASFQVKSTGKTSSTAMELLTNTANLPQGTYQITIKAEDAYGQTAYAKGTVTVSGIAQTGFEFYDYTDINHKITNGTLTIYFGEASAKLVAKGGQTTGLTYELDDPDLSVIDIHPNDGAITVKKTGKVRVKATKPANGTYSEAVIHMEVEVKPCEQVIAFDDPQDTRISYDETNGNTIQEAAQGTIKAGMPHAGNAGAGPISYTLGGTDAGIASISPSGLLTIHANQNITSAKTFTITARLNDSASSGYDANYGITSVTKTVYVYPPGSITWTQTSKPQADQTTGSERIGDLSVSGGSGTASYAISTSGDADNLDHAFFTIGSASGEVTLNKTITANDLIAKAYNTTEQGYELHVMVDVTDGGTTTTEHLTIYIKGAKRTNLDFKNRDSITKEITETYDVNKRFQIQLNQSIAGTTYRISTSPSHPSPADVITLDAGGNAAVLNANEARIDGGTTDPAYVEAVVPAVNGYEETTVEAPVRIKRTE